MMQHLAPRVLQSNGYSSKPIQIFRSILAGCKFSVAITRMYMLRNIKGLDESHKEANTSLFVDDTSMFASSSSCRRVREVLIPALLDFKKRVSDLKLKLSPKAVVVTNDPHLIIQLVDEFKKHKLFFLKAKTARDLGVSNTAGKSRPIRIVNKRLQLSKNRINKYRN
jgi:hypothetical protein